MPNELWSDNNAEESDVTVPLEFGEIPPEEEQKAMEQHWREMKDKRNRTMVYDPGSRKKMPLKQFESFYGTDKFSEEIIEATRNNTQYSKATAAKIKGMYANHTKSKVIPISQPRTNSAKTTEKENPKKAKQDQFIQMRYGFIDNVKDAECHHNPTALLLMLLKHRSWPGKMDRHHTYTHWYKEKGLIVASRSVEQMAMEIQVSEKTIRRWLKELEANGDIKKAKAKRGGYKRDNIYILGKIGMDGTEILYYHQN